MQIPTWIALNLRLKPAGGRASKAFCIHLTRCAFGRFSASLRAWLCQPPFSQICKPKLRLSGCLALRAARKKYLAIRNAELLAPQQHCTYFPCSQVDSLARIWICKARVRPTAHHAFWARSLTDLCPIWSRQSVLKDMQSRRILHHLTANSVCNGVWSGDRTAREASNSTTLHIGFWDVKLGKLTKLGLLLAYIATLLVLIRIGGEGDF